MSLTDRIHIAFDEGQLPRTGKVLAIRPPGPQFLDGFAPASLWFDQGFRPLHDALQAQGFQPFASGIAPFDLVMVFLTRSKVESLANIARALVLLRPGGWLVVDGAKTEGVESVLRQIKTVLPIANHASKAHGKVFWLQRPQNLPAILETLTEGLMLHPNSDGFLTTAGMFSADALDPGSKLLATHFEGKLKGRAADLGAGWGGLSARLLSAAPEITSLDLFEAEAAALDAARRNVPDPRAAFHWADVTKLTVTEPYDLVISNPPFHMSRAAEPMLGIDFIGSARAILAPRGTFLMVANRQLPYEAALEASFQKWEVLEQTGGYKIIRATRPRRQK